MRVFFRRLRGIVGIGLIWSTAWAVVGALFGVVQQFVLSHSGSGSPAGAGAMALFGALMFAIYAFPIGSLFGAILAVAERRRQLEQLNIWRISTWGCTAGGGVVLANVAAVWITGSGWPQDGAAATMVAAVLGVASAATTLRIARSGLQSSPAGTNTLPRHRSEPNGPMALGLGNQPSQVRAEEATARRR